MHELIEKFEKVGDQQITNVQAVHVGVGGKNHFFVTQIFEIVFDVESAHEIVHLVVLVNDVAFQIPNVQRLSFQHENRLRVHVSANDNGAGGGLSFGDKNHRATPLVLRF